MSESDTAPTKPRASPPGTHSPSIAHSTIITQEDHLYFLMPVILQVEDCLFKIPRSYLTKSSDIFKDMFSVPQTSGHAGLEGSSDKNPVKLPGVKKEDFRRLLEVLLPLNIPPSFDNIPKDGWVAVLRLAKMWEIYDVRQIAIAHLTKLRPPMTSVEKIVLAKEYFVEEWLRAGYEELVSRSSTLSDDEAEQISWKSAMWVCRIREEVQRSSYDITARVTTAVSKAFEEELKEMKSASENYRSSSP